MKRRVRCRHEAPAADLGRGSAPGNAARHVARAALRGAALALIGAWTAGCSVAVPIPGLRSDTDTVGSIDRTAAMLAPLLDREDLRRARAAMAVTLDPQGNGTLAVWQNPQTRAHGSFAAAAPPYTDHDRVCRRFSGEVVAAGHPARSLSGAACREGDGTWQVLASADTAA